MVCVEVVMRYKESHWEITEIEGGWRATIFFVSVHGTRGTVYNDFDTEAEAVMFRLSWR